MKRQSDIPNKSSADTDKEEMPEIQVEFPHDKLTLRPNLCVAYEVDLAHQIESWGEEDFRSQLSNFLLTVLGAGCRNLNAQCCERSDVTIWLYYKDAFGGAIPNWREFNLLWRGRDFRNFHIIVAANRYSHWVVPTLEAYAIEDDIAITNKVNLDLIPDDTFPAIRLHKGDFHSFVWMNTIDPDLPPKPCEYRLVPKDGLVQLRMGVMVVDNVIMDDVKAGKSLIHPSEEITHEGVPFSQRIYYHTYEFLPLKPIRKLTRNKRRKSNSPLPPHIRLSPPRRRSQNRSARKTRGSR
ncbi:MAG: hypothetical protein K1X53_12025 [Candidatus Sumerlaeaceae bacterium]|nr:hypothetical protein [Candidatus Sumerlaeaceae bacterium]